MNFFVLIFLLDLLVEGNWCLRHVFFQAPEAVRSGDSLTLSCTYILDREKLYSVKFYLEDVEFYSFYPRESPPTRVFNINGVPIKLQESQLNSSVLTLYRVQREMTGNYKCEVSADAPLFYTLIQSSLVTVTEEPLSSPFISADKLSYTVGEQIRARCTSRGGSPLANLTWLLNDQLVVTGVKRYIMETIIDSSILELQHKVSASMIEEGLIRLRCVAVQFNLYYAVTDLDLRGVVDPDITDTVSQINGSRRNINTYWLVALFVTNLLYISIIDQ